MAITTTLVQKTAFDFTVLVQDETGFGVLRNYQFVKNVPGKRYKGGTFDFINNPLFLEFGRYENLCIKLVNFVIENYDLIRSQESRKQFIFKLLS